MSGAAAPTPKSSTRRLREWAEPAASPLKVDKDRGVIEGVRVLGRFSRNAHGLRGAENGTEYTAACMEAARDLYEGCEVLVDHAPGKGRSAADVFGRLKNYRVGPDGSRADLHYLTTHPLAARVVEDVERGLGVYGLSHDATAGSERFDPKGKRLVVESLSAVRSVDLVRNPASNRNLWESRGDAPMQTTLRKLLEALKAKPAARRLIEDDALPGLDAPVEMPAAGGAEPDHEEALWGGFQAAMMAVLDGYKAGEMTAEEAFGQLKKYLKSHERLCAGGGGDDTDDPDAADAADEDKTESVKPGKAGPAAKIAALEHRLAVRDLVDEFGVRADKTLTETLEHLPLAKGRRLLEREAARGGSPKSSGVPKAPPAPAVPTDPKAFAASITATDF